MKQSPRNIVLGGTRRTYFKGLRKIGRLHFGGKDFLLSSCEGWCVVRRRSFFFASYVSPSATNSIMAPVEAPRQHGRKGAYVGGDWMDIEDCGEGFSIDHGSDKTCHKFQKGNPKCATCPRSRSRYVQAKEDGSYDVIVIGSGCIGSSIARELSKSNVSVLMLEAADDVTQGATKGNSGIVHAGFDDKPGTNRAKYCWPGNQMFADLDNELHFGYQKNGSLVIAKNAEEEEHLKELKKRGEINGVKRLKIIKKKELFELEPYANPEAVAALLSPDAGNLIPYEYAIAMAENAVDNGVELRIRRCVTEIKSSAKGFTVTADHWEPKIYANQVRNHFRGLYLYIAVISVSVEWCIIKPLSSSIKSYSRTSISHNHKLTFTLQPPFLPSSPTR